MQNPLVSICCQTYNHKEYISEAIEGFLMQKTDFPFEILLRDDASTDGTTDIVKDYSSKYPDLINPLIYTENQFQKGISPFRDNLKRAKGKYIAICEGDDYWTDPYKLQKQVDYLSRNENCNLVFTNMQLLDNYSKKIQPNWAVISKDIYSFKDLVQGNVITTCSVLFRNQSSSAEIENWLKHFTIGDYPLFLFLLRNGYAYFLNDITAVYRQHKGGVFSLKGIQYLIDKNIEVLETMEKLHLSKQESFYVRKSLIKWYYTKVVRMSSNFHFDEIRPFIRRKLTLFDSRYNLKYFLKTVVLFLFLKLKSGVFEKPQMTVSN